MYLQAAQTPQKATALDELIKHNLQTATPPATRGKDASWERKASRRFPDALHFRHCDNRASHRQVSQPELHCSPSPSPSRKARAEAEAVCKAPYRSSSGARTFLPAGFHKPSLPVTERRKRQRVIPLLLRSGCNAPSFMRR